jgi:hypothetical protein
MTDRQTDRQTDMCSTLCYNWYQVPLSEREVATFLSQYTYTPHLSGRSGGSALVGTACLMGCFFASVQSLLSYGSTSKQSRRGCTGLTTHRVLRGRTSGTIPHGRIFHHASRVVHRGTAGGVVVTSGMQARPQSAPSSHPTKQGLRIPWPAWHGFTCDLAELQQTHPRHPLRSLIPCIHCSYRARGRG